MSPFPRLILFFFERNINMLGPKVQPTQPTNLEVSKTKRNDKINYTYQSFLL